MIQASPNLLERKNRSSAKAIQDEKAKKRAKKEKKHMNDNTYSRASSGARCCKLKEKRQFLFVK